MFFFILYNTYNHHVKKDSYVKILIFVINEMEQTYILYNFFKTNQNRIQHDLI